ncbi:RNA polymerase sigma factor [Haliscomenobacter hydrossis]|uniref:RNA polymerase, sigma-24 subunit, ECF subfamily n=1 Tax=Haliscomenobacter hydrossis (strain ATCC 27775 / DSM 1100 / LMG 10767 / O) TaxID=760192 RepID=F4L8F2_HALH1|nr:RNA polymerase sigma factor [Haliscomenobacter hydrossis]AEE54660.1 RNA polymerase, sigma-24 subunit, ECF subfamily [Haliscomenobacter hydrossis DSM 1100]
MKEDTTLKQALQGDINAFQELFIGFQAQLKSYLYRLLANRNDAEDILHDTFIKAFDKLSTFKGESSLKTWVFQIATHLAYNYLQRQKRWTADVSEQAKKLVLENEDLRAKIVQVHESAADARYEMKEHIDTCFTCIGKNLPIENQIAVLLKDLYDFSVAEICIILGKTEGVVKYLLQDGRKIMAEIFDHRCALINKNGVCHQCSELNGWFNPKQQQQEVLIKNDLVKGSKKYQREELYFLRANLVKAIDPLRSKGAALQEILLHCNSLAMGEASNEG